MQEKNQIQVEEGIKLLADGMLFGLAKWLLLLGYDVAKRNPQDTIQDINEKYKDKIFLTMRLRDEEEKPLNYFLIKSKKIFEQVREVASSFPIDFKKGFLSRCSICNVLLEVVSIDEVKDRLPKLVVEWISECRRCPSCDRLYWQGTHCDRMRETIKDKIGIEV